MLSSFAFNEIAYQFIYNKTKCGVDVVDQMARTYSVKAGCF